MIVLLDTHTFVWLLTGSERLVPAARDIIQQAAEDDVLYLSAISPWEIAMLVSKNRLVLDRDIGEWMQQALSLPGIKLAPLSMEISIASTRLPGVIHADPADRMIVATARHLSATLITDDQLMLNYSLSGHLKAFKAGC